MNWQNKRQTMWNLLAAVLYSGPCGAIWIDSRVLLHLNLRTPSSQNAAPALDVEEQGC